MWAMLDDITVNRGYMLTYVIAHWCHRHSAFNDTRRILWFCSLASNSLPRKVLQTSLEKDLIQFAIPIFPWGSPFSRNSFPLNLLVFTQLSMHISIIMPLFATSVVPPKSEGNEMLLYRLEQWLNAKFRKNVTFMLTLLTFEIISENECQAI